MSEAPKRRQKRGSPSPQILRAVLRLREMILTGALPPGQRVAELKVVDVVGVSRTPLRLAMEKLEHEGLLARRSSGGFTVREFTLRDVQQAIELRGSLEGTACRFAAEARAERDLAPLWHLVSTLDTVLQVPGPTVETFNRYVELNERFHDTIIDLAGNPLLTRLVDQVRGLPFGSPSAFVQAQVTSPESFRILLVAQEQHRTIAQAITDGDGARAESLAREHARLALRNLDAAVRDVETFRRMPGGRLVRVG
jgi:GntR family transcriptional regulator, vanillate catabolism transcriptional regulator